MEWWINAFGVCDALKSWTDASLLFASVANTEVTGAMQGELTLWQGIDFWRGLALSLFGVLVGLIVWIIYRHRKHQRVLLNLNRQVLAALHYRRTIRNQGLQASALKGTVQGPTVRTDSGEGISSHNNQSSSGTLSEKISDTIDSGSSEEPAISSTDFERQRRMRELYQKVVQLLESESLALDPELNLDSLARRVSSNQKYVSQAISEVGGSNFYTLVNGYRIQAALETLSDVSKDVPSGDVLAQECGFGSRSSFYEVFKRHTGLTPRTYRKEVLRKA